jgi:hypothetical protein
MAASEEALFRVNRLRPSLDVDVMSLHDEIARQSRTLERLSRHARDLAFEVQSLHAPSA